jgi:hypothetical protein
MLLVFAKERSVANVQPRSLMGAGVDVTEIIAAIRANDKDGKRSHLSAFHDARETESSGVAASDIFRGADHKDLEFIRRHGPHSPIRLFSMKKAAAPDLFAPENDALGQQAPTMTHVQKPTICPRLHWPEDKSMKLAARKRK